MTQEATPNSTTKTERSKLDELANEVRHAKVLVDTLRHAATKARAELARHVPAVEAAETHLREAAGALYLYLTEETAYDVETKAEETTPVHPWVMADDVVDLHIPSVDRVELKDVQYQSPVVEAVNA
jgi:hypothetical protein